MADALHTGTNSTAGSAKEPCLNGDKTGEDSKTQKKKTVKIRASLFFDGTQNNRTNIDHRVSGDETYKKMKGWTRKAFSTKSYDNDYTNIAKLEKYCMALSNGFDEHFPQYIEGIGTTDHATDSRLGMAVGKGDTGIKAKVENGIKHILSSIFKKINRDTTIIEDLCLDAFGFSRGAAAARYFVYATLEKEKETLKEKLQAKGYEIAKVECKFIGLFDTVAAFGLPGNHKNNTTDLHLNAIRNAQQVVHLVADDEHRKNFPLTNINSKGGNEIILPGVHSDIGGGYRGSMDEVDLQILDIDFADRNDQLVQERLNREKKWLIEKGWYVENEIQDVNYWNELRVKRYGIRNTYSRIPLHIMKKHAHDNGLNFRMSIDAFEPIPQELNGIKNILGDDGKGDWKGQTELVNRIRHKYFHFSAYYGSIGMEPNFTNDDAMSGSRWRMNYDG